MKQEQFAQGKDLQDRIFALNYFKEYLKGTFKSGKLSVYAKIQIFRGETQEPLIWANTDSGALPLAIKENNDAQYILDKIDERIAALQKQFDEL